MLKSQCNTKKKKIPAVFQKLAEPVTTERQRQDERLHLWATSREEGEFEFLALNSGGTNNRFPAT